ncbi:MAG: threonyl-tRNA synthetase editing domain-containing protein, partial [candidate division Zixibacteria bacterium]|nr:threonyl-tRNA synthetase editing domain-containing protein [candidate division Zixibacteria bacterium]
MKLLMIYATRFGYTTSLKALDDAVERSVTTALADVLVGLIHVEAADESDPAYAETKLVKNLKWAARKNDSNRILLHSFAHLAESKASPD